MDNEHMEIACSGGDEEIPEGLIESPSFTRARLTALGLWPQAERLLESGGWGEVQRIFPPKVITTIAPDLVKPDLMSMVAETIVKVNEEPEEPKEPPKKVERVKVRSIPDEILWVYDHLDVVVKKEDCPTRGAWGLLSYAKKKRQQFYERLLPRAHKELAKSTGGDMIEHERRAVATIRAMIVTASK